MQATRHPEEIRTHPHGGCNRESQANPKAFIGLSQGSKAVEDLLTR
jgi:hypothetical protein